MIISWPRAVADPGAVRSGFAHAIDLAPTIRDAAGVNAPEVVDGVIQRPFDGASLLASITDPDAPDARFTQSFEMLGSRSIINDGWQAATNHISIGGLDEEVLAEHSRSFDENCWDLFKLDADSSETIDLFATHPERVAELQALWRAEAERNQASPIDDSFVNRLGALIPPLWPAGDLLVLLPGGGPMIAESLPLLFGGFRFTVEVEIPEGGAEGVLFAIGNWNGGYALFLRGGRLCFTFSLAGIPFSTIGDRPVIPWSPSARSRL